MTSPSFQTVQLSRGSHPSPADGVCVMELASMLGGERFSDHPRSVCPVVAVALRAYNDAVDDDRRQSLYAYASTAVDTRCGRQVRNARLEACERFLGDRLGRRSRLFHSRLQAVGLAVSEYGRDATPARHDAFLALIDRLVRLGGGRTMPLPPPACGPEAGARLRRA